MFSHINGNKLSPRPCKCCGWTCRSILKHNQNTYYPRFSLTPKTSIAFAKIGVLFLLCSWSRDDDFLFSSFRESPLMQPYLNSQLNSSSPDRWLYLSLQYNFESISTHETSPNLPHTPSHCQPDPAGRVADEIFSLPIFGTAARLPRRQVLRRIGGSFHQNGTELYAAT